MRRIRPKSCTPASRSLTLPASAASAGCTAADYTRGFLSQYVEHPTATGDTNILRRHTYTYTQDTNQMPTVQSVTTELDPNTADAKTTKTDQTVDLYGNVTQARAYEYGNLTTPVRTTNCTYTFPGAHYLRNLLYSCNVTDGVNTSLLASSTYDVYGTLNPLTQVTGSPTKHDTPTTAPTSRHVATPPNWPAPVSRPPSLTTSWAKSSKPSRTVKPFSGLTPRAITSPLRP